MLTNAKRLLSEYEKRLEGFEILIFGSARFATYPNDIDLLFVYDANRIEPKDVYPILGPVLIELESKLNVPINHVVLSLDEDRESAFSSSVDAMCIAAAKRA